MHNICRFDRRSYIDVGVCNGQDRSTSDSQQSAINMIACPDLDIILYTHFLFLAL